MSRGFMDDILISPAVAGLSRCHGMYVYGVFRVNAGDRLFTVLNGPSSTLKSTLSRSYTFSCLVI
jgi:hypothetical protein